MNVKPRTKPSLTIHIVRRMCFKFNQKMEHKEKAIELASLFSELANESNITQLGIKSAILCVDELIKITAPVCDRFEQYYQCLKDEKTANYWIEVKAELECL